MSKIEWYLEASSFGACNCIYACPCQFEALPTHGDCRGFEAFRVDKGYFGNVKLDGLKVALLYAWPGPVFEGKGEMQVITDESASAEQREALTRVVQGEETDEGATHWWVFRTMSEKVHPALSARIDFEIDIEARKARVRIPGVLEASGRPIKSPATGNEHRVRIDIPKGIEFEVAEIGSGTVAAHAAIKLDLKDTYGQFNRVRHSRTGVVHG